MQAERQLAFLWGCVALSIVALAPVASPLIAGLPSCPLLALSGIPCPTCGSGRAAQLLSRFEFLEALRHFPLATLGWSALIGGGLLAGLAAIFGHGVPRPAGRWLPWIRWSLLAAVAANWLFLILSGAASYQSTAW